MSEYLEPGVYIEEGGHSVKPIKGVNTCTAGFVGMAVKGPLNIPTLVNSKDQFVKIFGKYASECPDLAPAVFGFFENGGRRCFVVRVGDQAADADYIGTNADPANQTGLQALNDISEVNIICIPGITSKTVQTAMIAHCESLKDRICILDSVKNSNIDDIQNQRNDVGSENGYATLYYPWIKVAIDIEDGENIKYIHEFVPPSGHIAGLYARNDIERGVHKAPANQIVMGALEIKEIMTNSKQEILNPRGINCIRAFSGRGIRVWGARTTASSGEYIYINVRRLLIYLETTIKKGTLWTVYEPNAPPLWTMVRKAISAFLIDAWKSGALLGTRPEEAFFVRFDRTTMTQDDLSNGRLYGLIGVALMKPEEYIIIRITLMSGDS